MRALTMTVFLASSLAMAQRPPEAVAPSGTGYSVVTSTPRPTVVAGAAAAAAPPPQTAASSTSTVTVVSGRPAAPAAAPPSSSASSRGPRGPGDDGLRSRQGTEPVARVSADGVAYAVGPGGAITSRPAAPPAQDPDAGVDDPSIATAGALFGGPLPGPSIYYMGQQVNTRRPSTAPPLAPGAVRPEHALPGSVAAPPSGPAPWIPHTTSGFQLGPSGASTETSGYGFQLSTGQRSNPGTLRPSP